MLTALSLCWPYIAGLGALPALVLAGQPAPAGTAGRERTALHLLAAMWSFGLCLNYLLVLVLGSLAAALLLGSVLAVALGGLALWLYRARLGWLRPIAPWALAFAVFIVLAAAIVLDPLHDWDARVIWFLHGKMIYFGGGLTPEIGLNAWSVPHPDYPKLVAVMAAEVATLVGFWNEYLPKLSLVLLLPTPILALLTLRRRPLTLAVGIFGFLAIPQQFLANGSMDGYLALYAAVATLFLADWLEGGGDAALLAAVGALGVAGGLKLEGQILYVAIALAGIALLLVRRIRLSPVAGPVQMLLPLPFVPFAVWHGLVGLWSLKVEHFSLGIAWRRLGDLEAVRLILDEVVLDPRIVVAVIILLAAAVLGRWRAGRLPSAAWLPLLAGLLYLGATCVIFLMYPEDLTIELSMAAGRVIRAASALLLVAALVVLRTVEAESACAAGPVAER